jgi:hypothetical protein
VTTTLATTAAITTSQFDVSKNDVQQFPTWHR